MAPKRKGEDVPGQTGREKKKQKTSLARTIAVQPATGTHTPAQSSASSSSRVVHFQGGSFVYVLHSFVTSLSKMQARPHCLAPWMWKDLPK